MGKGLVEKLKREFSIQDEWVSYELRPETPPEGIPLTRRFSPEDLHRIYENLRRTGEPLGIIFGEVKVTSNSRSALQAVEFARDRGHFHSFHNRVFYAYFTDTRDIGNVEVLLDLAQEDGLDPAELQRALAEGTYLSRLFHARRDADALGVTAVPTFVVDGTHKIVGAPSPDLFRKRLAEVQSQVRPG
ncbi:MAG: DsbA family protein [Desulfomonilaceae bacterium]|nr:DsbA family protein [Desulfomonilaceae bacterium]